MRLLESALSFRSRTSELSFLTIDLYKSQHGLGFRFDPSYALARVSELEHTLQRENLNIKVFITVVELARKRYVLL
jgi:hypothetical protein